MENPLTHTEKSDSPFEDLAFPKGSGLYKKGDFIRMLYLERKRTERSKRPFLLMLLNIEDLIPVSGKGAIQKMDGALSSCIRETDVRGWYENGRTLGIIFTEMKAVDEIVKDKIFLKIQDKLTQALGADAVQRIKVSYHIFPEANNGNGKTWEWFNAILYPEVTGKARSRKMALFLKRLLDLTGSLLGLVVSSPIFLIASLAIKLTSEGPIFFRQERLGQGGKKFTFLKFRSMYINSDEKKHKDFITNFIAAGEEGKGAADKQNGETVIYKLTGDKRITPIGRFLRKTSLDELPQFLNVLKGDMSLVGPRPPIPYECELYDIWHRQRLLEAKPGITGLWQVEGRSQRAFNDMVRLDLRYINEWSLWLDLKIILKTPWVMLTGSGGY